jgi:hypothetical protein
MQEKPHSIFTGKRGRPKTSRLTARELARNRKRRQRAKMKNSALSKVEVLIPRKLKAEIKSVAGNQSLSDIGLEAFSLWLRDKKKRAL